jgi:hypothetical protein
MKIRRGDPCSIEGCGKPVVGRGWCSMHYARWRTYGDPLYQTRRYAPQGKTCAVEGCERRPRLRGLCDMHAKRLANHGEATDPRQRRFWAQVDKRSDDECWPWIGYSQPNGYGVRSNHRPGETRLAHRIAYQILVGPIPPGLVLDHVCHTRNPSCQDNDQCPHRRCCNPAHLEPVTRRENIARGNGGTSWGYMPDPLPARTAKAPRPATCTEDDCDRSVYKRTICRPHYRKWLRDPSVERPSQRTPEQRFWAKVEKTPTCWLWIAYVNPSTGYGQFGLTHGVMVGAHRFSYELVHGPVPDGFDVHHMCLTRRCVNPDHLEAVSRAENLRLRANRRI